MINDDLNQVVRLFIILVSIYFLFVFFTDLFLVTSRSLYTCLFVRFVSIFQQNKRALYLFHMFTRSTT